MHLSKTKFWHASTIVDICLICPCPTITPSDTRPNKVHAELKEASRWVATESVRWGRLGGSWILSLFMLRIDKFSWSSYGIREQGIHMYRKNKETRVCSMNHEICGWSVFRIIFNATRRFQASCRFLWKKHMATHPSRDTGKPANPKFFEIVIKILHDEINKVKTPQLDGWWFAAFDLGLEEDSAVAWFEGGC